MTTLGWVFILVSILLMRAVVRGRVMNVGEDISDAFLAFANGDTDGLKEVLARSGEGATPDFGPEQTGVERGVKTAHGFEPSGTSLAKAAIRLGEKASGYQWAATGPNTYDCSGLMWRAAQAIGYKGGRFTTATIRNDRANFRVISQPGMSGPNVTAAGYDDIVLWPAGSGGLTGHMGVITGPDRFYSARSARSGIGEAKISTFRKTKPIYIRYVGPRKESDPFK